MGARGRHVPDASHHRPDDICLIHSTLLGAPMNHDGYALACEKVERPIVDLANLGEGISYLRCLQVGG